MDNDAMKHELDEVLSLVQEQMRDLSAMQQKRSELTAKATAADGAVEVSVDAQGIVTGVVIDESYLKDFELADLGAHIAEASREAAEEIGRRAAAMLEPLTQRRGAIRAMSDIAVDIPEFGDALASLNLAAPPGNEATAAAPDEDGWDGRSSFPSVRQ